MRPAIGVMHVHGAHVAEAWCHPRRKPTPNRSTATAACWYADAKFLIRLLPGPLLASVIRVGIEGQGFCRSLVAIAVTSRAESSMSGTRMASPVERASGRASDSCPTAQLSVLKSIATSWRHRPALHGRQMSNILVSAIVSAKPAPNSSAGVWNPGRQWPASTRRAASAAAIGVKV